MQLKDVAFSIIIIIMTTLVYYYFQEIDLTLFALFFFGICYLETETITLLQSLKTGHLKLRDDYAPQLKEYSEVIRGGMKPILPLASILTGIVFSLRETPGIHYLVLLCLFMWAISVILVGFSVFLAQLSNSKPLAKPLLLNSVLLWVYSIVSAIISGEVAYRLGVPFFTDILVTISPIVIYEFFRLNFVRNALFSFRFSSIEQSSKALDLFEKDFNQGDPFLKKIEVMKKRIGQFLTKTIVLTQQQEEILSQLKPEELNNQFQEREKSQELLNELEEIVTRHNLQKSGEKVEFVYPLVLDGKSHVSTKFYSKEVITGYSIFEIESKSFVYDLEIVKKLALSTVLLERIEKEKTSIWAKLRIYFMRVYFLVMDAFDKYFGWQITREISDWISHFNKVERAKHEGLIGLHITALVDHILERSIFYNALISSKAKKKFLRNHNYSMTALIFECKKRDIALLAEKLETSKQRANYAAIGPTEVIGSKYVRTSSEKIRNNISAKKSKQEESLLLLNDEMEKLITNLRVPN